jgi:hypothetical protein
LCNVYRSQRYYSGQISIIDLRNDGVRKRIWEGIDIGDLLASTLRLFAKMLNSEETKSQLLLRQQILKSIVLLSDLFSITEFEWMCDMFQKLYEKDEIDDILIKQYLVMGICKSAAVVQQSPKIPNVQYISKLIRLSVESTEANLQIAALNGILYLLEAQANKVRNTFIDDLPYTLDYSTYFGNSV